MKILVIDEGQRCEKLPFARRCSTDRICSEKRREFALQEAQRTQEFSSHHHDWGKKESGSIDLSIQRFEQTPLNNNIRELFNLMNFLDPDAWSDLAALEQEYEELTEELVKQLHERLRPYFLRRIKSQVLTLPPKVS